MRVFKIGIALSLVVIIFCVGFFTSQVSYLHRIKNPINDIAISSQVESSNLFNDALLQQVWAMIQQSYYRPDEIDPAKLYYGAIGGFVSGLEDPHTFFLDPEITSAFEEQLQGSFEGIGAEVSVKDDVITIVAPLPNSPAEKAGIKPGDKIYAIDGQDSLGMTLDEGVKLIRGEKGTAVELLILRGEDFVEIEVIRDEIEVDSIKWEIKDDVLYFRAYSFTPDLLEEMDKMLAMVDLEKINGIILDLRNNPGGLLPVAVQMTGKWVENDVALIERFSNGEETVYRTQGEAIFKDFPTVVLVNMGSASASEILAGALQDYDLAEIVGTKTFGKGSVQTFSKLPDGSSLKLTIAEWVTPSEQIINNNGLTPDVEVEFTEEDYLAKKDPQLEKALEILSVN